MAVHKMDFNNC